MSQFHPHTPRSSPSSPTDSDSPSTASVLGGEAGVVLLRVSTWVEAELKLLRAQFDQKIEEAGIRLLQGLLIFGFVLLGLGALLASAILALGSVWGDRYGLSALVLGALMLLIGVGIAKWSGRKKNTPANREIKTSA